MHRLHLVRPIKSGRHGTVYKAFDSFAHAYRAVKVLPRRRRDMPSSQNTKMINREIEHMMAVSAKSHYVVRLFDVVQDDEAFYLVQELCAEHTLREIINESSDDVTIVSNASNASTDLVSMLHDITHAIQDCHACNIFHGDVKPDNILLSSGGTFKLQATTSYTMSL
jgi:eukaryotic-like serine/threonine-protein kinase